MNKDNGFVTEHKCDKMPDNVRFSKVQYSSSTQFTLGTYGKGVHSTSTTLYGFKYCPYCGEKFVE